MKRTGYIETTIPFFYYETRQAAQFVAMRQWILDWWRNEMNNYQCFTSDAVINELEAGMHPKKG